MKRTIIKKYSFVLVLGVYMLGCAAVSQKPHDSADHIGKNGDFKDSGMPDQKKSIHKIERKERPISALAVEHYLRARLYEQQGKLGNAVGEMRRSLVYDHSSAYLHTSLAVLYAMGGQWPMVGRGIREALKIDPDYIPALLMQAQSQKVLGLSEAAVQTYRKVIQLDPNRVDAYIYLSNLLIEMGNEREGEEILHTMLKYNPNSEIGTRRMAELYFEQGDEKKAERYFRRVLEIRPSETASIEALSGLLERQGRYQEAIEVFIEALEVQPEYPRYMAYMARLYMKSGDQESAQAYFEQLRVNNPRNAGYIAQVYGSLGRHREAILELEALLDKNPDFYLERLLLAYMHLDRKEYEKAIRNLERIPKGVKYYLDAQINIGACLSSLKKYERAIAVLNHALELSVEREDLARIYRILGLVYGGSGRIDEGLKRLDEAIEQNPDLLDLVEPKAGLLVEAGKGEQGVSLLEEAIDKDPKNISLIYSLGALYERMGNVAMSIKTMRRVLEIDPNNYSALNFIGYSLADLNEDLDEAERLVRRALLLDPGSGAVMDSLGWVLFRKGDYQQALEYLKRANDMSPQEAIIIMHLGDTYLKLGNRKEALKHYRRALHTDPDPRDRKEILIRFKELGIKP